MRKKIIIITELFFLKAGSQSLQHTVEQYSKQFDVILITPEYFNNIYEKKIQINNVKIIKIPTILGIITKYFKKKQTDYDLVIQNNKVEKGKFKVKYPFNKKYDYIKYEYKIKHRIKQYLNFSVTMILFLFLNINWKNISLIIGYERRGVKIGKLMSVVFRKKFIVKYQGTFEIYNSLFNSYYSKRNLWLELFFIKTNADYFLITNDGSNSDKLLINLGINPSKILFQKNGYCVNDLNKYESIKGIEIKKLRDKFNIPKDAFTLLTVNRLNFWKRVDRVIYALKDILNEKTFLFIIGDGSEREYLMKLVNYYNIDRFVIFIGALNHNDIIKYYKMTDVYIQYCDYLNLSNQIMEAFSYNKPIITLNDGSTDEFLIHNINCFKVNQSNIENETVKYVNLLRNRDVYKRIVKGIKKTKPLMNTWEERLKKEINIINKLI